MYFPGATACSLSVGVEVPFASRAVTSTGTPGFGRAGSWRTAVGFSALALAARAAVVTPRTIRARTRIGRHARTEIRERARGQLLLFSHHTANLGVVSTSTDHLPCNE